MKNAIKRKYMTRVALIFVIAVLVCGLVLGNGALIRDALFPNELDFVSPEKSGEQGSSEWKDPDNIDTSYLATLEDGGGIVPTSGAGGHPWPYTDIDTGKFHMILADQDGFVYTRGSNEKQQLGLGAAAANMGSNINSLDGTYNSTANYFNYWQPVIALNHIRATSVSAGGYHSVAIGYEYDKSSTDAYAYKVYTWGEQANGKLGNGQTSGTTGIPQDITNNFGFDKANGEYPIKVSAGEFHTLLLTNKNRVWAWGSNTYGQLGNNSTSDASNPVQVNNNTGFTDIAAGFMHSLALKSNKLWSWGGNTSLQLGGNTTKTAKQLIPKAIFTSLTVHQISAALHNTAVNTSTNTLYTWGDDRGGKLGRGLGKVNADGNDPANCLATTLTYTGVKMAVATETGTVAVNTSNNLRVTGYQVNTYYNVTADGTFKNTTFAATRVAGNGCMTIAVTSDNQMYAFGNAAKYSEQWYANPQAVPGGPTWSDGTTRYDTSKGTPSNVSISSADNLKRLTPANNIIGLPTNYNRTADASSGITVRDNLIVYNHRVKLNAFNLSSFAVAQVAQDVYNNASYTSVTTWKSVTTKGVIINREGYYMVRYNRNGSTAYTRFTISNKKGPEVTVNTTFNNANCVASINLYDGFGVKSVRVQGTAKKYAVGGGYTTFEYDTGVQSVSGYNTSFNNITANSNGTFTVTAVDINDISSTTQVTINTVVNPAQAAYSGQFSGSSHTVAPLFHRPSEGAGTTFNLSTFASRYGGNGYTASISYAGGDGDFTAGSTGPITVNTNPYTATVSILKNGAATGIASYTSNMTITKKPITVVANNISKGRSQAQDPALTYTATGVVSGYPLTGALTRDPGNTVGTYAIKIGTLGNKNYTINFTGAIFTILDDIKPIISAVSASPTTWTSGNVVLTVTAYDEDTAIATVTCNGAATTKAGDQYSFTATQNGTYTFTATDTSNNSNTSSYSVTNIDKVTPSMTFTPSVTDGQWTGGDITFTFHNTVGISGIKKIEYTNNGGSTWTDTGSTTSYTTNVVGVYTYQFRITSNASLSALSPTYLAKIDKDEPVWGGYTINTSDIVSTSTGVILTVNATDVSSGVANVKYGSTQFTKNGDNYSLAFYHSGVYSITITDNVGNTTTQNAAIRNIDEVGATIYDVEYPQQYTKTVVPLTFKVGDFADAVSDPAGVKTVYINGNPLTEQDGVYSFIMDENIRYTIETEDNVGNISVHHIDVDLIFAVTISARTGNDPSEQPIPLGTYTIGDTVIFPVAQSVQNFYYSGWQKDDGEVLIIAFEKELNFVVRYNDRKNFEVSATWTLSPIYREITQGDITFRYTGADPSISFDLPDGLTTAFEYYLGATIIDGVVYDGIQLAYIPYIAGDYVIKIILLNDDGYWVGNKAVHLTIQLGILTPTLSSYDWADQVTVTVNLEESIPGAIDAFQYSIDGGHNWGEMIRNTNQCVIDWDNNSVNYVFRAYKSNTVVSEVSVPVTVKVDTFVPEIDFEASGTSDIWSSQNILFDVSYQVGISGLAWIEYQRDGGQWLPIMPEAGIYTYLDNTNGTEQFKFRVTNNANIAVESSVFISKIDKVTPVVTFTASGTSNVWTALDNVFTIDSQMGYSGINKVEYTVNNGESWITVLPQAGVYSVTDNTTGERVYKFRTTSNAGLIGVSGEFISRIDKVMPTIGFTASAPSDTWCPENIVFTLTTSTGPSGIQGISYTLDGTTWTPVIGSTHTDTDSNIETYRFRIINRAGIEAFSGTFTSKIDKQQPQIEVSTDYNGQWTSSAVRYTFDITHGISGAVVRYKTDLNQQFTQAGITADGSNPNRFYLELNANIDTNYYFEVISGAGLIDTGDTQGYVVRIDKVNPNIVYVARNESNQLYTADTWTDNTITFRFNLTFGASGGTLYYSLNEGISWHDSGEITISDNHTAAPYIVLTDTQNRHFSFKLVNGAGVSQDVTFGNVKIDKNTPYISVSASYQTVSGQVMAYNSGIWVSRDVKFAITCSGIGLSGVNVYYSTDRGETWSQDNVLNNGLPSAELTVTASQKNDYVFKLVNGVGNYAQYEFNRVWIDKIAPSFSSVEGYGVRNARFDDPDPAYNGWYISDHVITFNVNYGLSGGVVEYSNDSMQWFRDGILNNTQSETPPTLTITDNSTNPQHYYFRIVSGAGVASTSNYNYGIVKVDTTDYYIRISQYVDTVLGTDYAAVNVQDTPFKRGQTADVVITPNPGYDFKNTTYSDPETTEFSLDIKDADHEINAYFYKHINVTYTGLNQYIKGRLTTNVTISVQPAVPYLTFTVEYYSGANKLERVPSDMGTYEVRAISNNINYIIDNSTALMTVVYFEGDGTSQNPHLVNSRDDFTYINNYYNNPDPAFDYLGENRLNAYYLQTANIALTAAFPSIERLAGTFDGGNYEFTAETLTLTSSFGIAKILDGGTIKNVGVRIGTLNVQAAGALTPNIGFIAGVVTNGGAITHSYAVGSVVINSTSSVNIGALAGKVEDGCSVTHSFADVDIRNINVVRGNIGGIAGLAQGESEFANLYSLGQITIINSDEANTVVSPFVSAPEGIFTANLFLENNTYHNGNIINDSYAGIEFADYAEDILRCETIINNDALPNSKSVEDLARIKLNLTGLTGNGNAVSPFEIYNLNHLQAMDKYLWATFMLMNDIDIAGGELSVIGLGKVFSGSLEGNGNTIKNAVMVSDAQYVGLFGVLSGSVRGFRLININIDANRNADSYTYVGGIAGLAIDGALIEHVVVSGEFKAQAAQSKLFLGGLIGLGDGVNISNSLSSAAVISLNTGIAEVGGIAGRLSGDANVENSFAIGRVDASFSDRGQAGIFAGVVIASTINNTTGATDKLYANSVKLNDAYGVAANSQIINNILSSYNTILTNEAFTVGSDRLIDIMANQVSIFNSGVGTTANPYRISTPEQLMQINNYLSSHFVLANNINLSGIQFSSIGKGKKFTGTFNGNGFSISHVTDALFDTNEGTIQNITISVNYNKTGSEDIVFGAAAKVNYGNIKSVIVDGNATVNLTDLAVAKVGGIAGINYGTIDYVVNSITVMNVNAPIAFVGGITGVSEAGSKIIDPRADKTINVSGGSIKAGIVTGWSKAGATLEDYSMDNLRVTVRVRGTAITDLFG